MTRARRAAQAGVTLIEMLVVVTIIALFAALVAPNVLSQLDKGKDAAAIQQIADLMSSVTQYKSAVGNFPTTEQGLQALWTKPAGVDNWSGPYTMKEVPLDPWGREYAYRYPGPHGDMPEIISYGADGQPGGEGVNADVISWQSRRPKK